MSRALILVVSAIVFFSSTSCSNNSGQKTAATLNDTMHGDTLIIKDSVSVLKQNIFYPDSSADTNLLMREGNVSVYSIGSYDIDCVVKLENQSYKSFKVWEEDMLEFKACLSVHSQQVNNKGNKEVIICFAVEGEHSYGDDNGGGWYENRKYAQIWDIDSSRVFFECIPYLDFWNKGQEDGKTKIYSDFYQYDFNIYQDNKIVLSNLIKKVNDKPVPSKAKKADVRMGTYQFQNDSFIWVSSQQ